jgi:urease accessory protein
MIAEVTIQVALRNGISSLQHSYNTPPFKIADITEDKKAGILQLMLMSSSPGILDGDEYRLQVSLDENCFLQLHTQSYQRLFNMKKGAVQYMDIQLKQGASFTYLPHPTVPHGQSVFTARNKIYLQQHCRLIWGEVLTCGRKLNGEVFHFSKYHSITDIYMNDRLLVKENLLVQPAITDIYATGQWEGYTHQASLICFPGIKDATTIIEIVYEKLLQLKEVVFGISSLSGNGFIVRLLGYKAELLHECLKTIATLVNSSKQLTKPVYYVN